MLDTQKLTKNNPDLRNTFSINTVEKRLIEEGEMETWVTKTFGGDRFILVPSLLPGNGSAVAARMSSIGQDAFNRTCAVWCRCCAELGPACLLSVTVLC